MSKAKEFFGKCKKKVLGVVTAAFMVVTTAVTAFAAEGASDPAFNVSDISTVLDPVKAQFTFANVASILALVVGAAAVLVLGWFGVRKVIAVIQSALKKSRLKV